MSKHQMPGFRPGICCSDSIYQPIDVLTPNAWLQARNLLLRLYIPAHWCPYTKCQASGKESAAQTLHTSPLISLYQMPGFRPEICCSDSIYQPIDVQTPNAWLQARNSAVYILFWPFEISDNILRNQKWGLDSYSRQVFTYLDPILIISVFGSTAYLKFAKLQYVSSGVCCRMITGSLMRLY